MRDDVLAERDRLVNGSSLLGGGVGGKNFTWARLRIQELREEMELILAALQSLNPDLYGRKVKKTYGDFSRATDR